MEKYIHRLKGGLAHREKKSALLKDNLNGNSAELVDQLSEKSAQIEAMVKHIEEQELQISNQNVIVSKLL
jgi:hypothetical protein